jgi:hypothetical protein
MSTPTADGKANFELRFELASDERDVSAPQGARKY